MRHEFTGWRKDSFRNILLNPGLKPYWMALFAILVFTGCGGGHSTPPPQAPQHFLYGRNGTTIYAFGEDKTGALSPLAGSPFTVTPNTTPFTASGLSSDPQGRFLFIPAFQGSICCPVFAETAYSVNANSGAVASSAIANLNEGRFAFHPSGKFLYIPTETIQFGVLTFHGIAGVDLSTSNLAAIPGSPFSNGQEISVASIDPAGHFLYTSGSVNPGLPTRAVAFETYSADSNTGLLTLISTDTTPGVQPTGPILFHPSGKFGYAFNNRSSQVIDLYSVNTTTGALTFINTQVSGQFVNTFMYSSGNFLYGCISAGVFGQPCQPVAYRVDSNTGVLTPIPGFSLGPGDGRTLVIDKSGQFADALNTSVSSGNPSNQIFVYSIDSSTGLMTQIPSLTINISAGVTTIATGR